MTSRTPRAPLAVTLCLAILMVIALAACTSEESRTFQLETLNDSGVTGTAVLTDLRDGSTRVVIDVDPAGHLNMPAHIHPGTCVELVPQPLHPLESVVDGESETVVEQSLSELLAGDLALNLHVSFEDMGTYAACVDLT
ncbi:MAG TPA: hypothetical protein VFJ00_04000 [Candidatus Limnocylindria bacterium]|nr:hypothetical protein [Candidatus Limnocylindria bacterium]